MVRIAVIGCGYWGPNLIRNFSILPQASMAWVCDVDTSRLAHIRSLHPSVQTTTSLDEIIAKPDIDAVAIATPPPTHYSFAKRLLAGGKDVLLEKPITQTREEAKELIDIAKRNKRILMVDHTFIYTPAVQKMKELLDSKALGKLCYFDSIRINLGLFQQDTNVLWDLAPHDLSIMDYLIGKNPLSISAVGASHVRKNLENIVYVTVRYPNNFLAHIHVNWLAPVKIRRTVLCGYKKMIVYDDMEPIEKIKVYDRGIHYMQKRLSPDRAMFQYRMGDMYSPRLDDIEALNRMCQHFVSCVANRTTPTTDGYSGLRIVTLLEAAQKSLQNNGKFITINV